MVSKKGTGCTFRHKKGTALFKAKKCNATRVHMKGKGGKKAPAQTNGPATRTRSTKTGKYMKKGA